MNRAGIKALTEFALMTRRSAFAEVLLIVDEQIARWGPGQPALEAVRLVVVALAREGQPTTEASARETTTRARKGGVCGEQSVMSGCLDVYLCIRSVCSRDRKTIGCRAEWWARGTSHRLYQSSTRLTAEDARRLALKWLDAANARNWALVDTTRAVIVIDAKVSP
jgi:hypothetical protein